MVKFPLVALAIPVAVVIIGLGSYSYVQNTPQYSIYKIDQSVKEGDYATFQKYVDVDTTLTSIMANVTQSAQQQLAQTDCKQIVNLFNCLVLNSIAKQNLADNPQAKAKIMASIKQQVECKCSYDNSFHVDNLMADLSNIKVTYDNGMASTTLHSDKYGDLTLKFKMENGVWRVVDGIPDAKAIQIFSGPTLNNTSK